MTTLEEAYAEGRKDEREEWERNLSSAPWVVGYDNDVGPEDGGFWEWWTVSNGGVSFQAKSEMDAKWLCSVLNMHAAEWQT